MQYYFKTQINMSELLTIKQKERKVRDGKIVEAFKAMREKYPNATPSRIMHEMASRGVCGLKSYCGIRSALIRYGYLNEKQS